jgi:hypothetical protein
MKYLNGRLRSEQDSTLYLRPYSQQQKLTWAEYLPLVILGVLLAGLLLQAIFG